MKYNIKILENKEFDKLAIPNVETSLGVADPKTGTAYVRYSEVPGLNEYLVNHELEHLLGEDTTHYRDGYHYKDLGGVGSKIATTAGQGTRGTGAGTPGSYGPGSMMGNLFSGGKQGGGFNMGQLGMGAGLMGLGSLMPNPSVPQLPDSFSKFQQQGQVGGGPMGQLAQQQMTQRMGQTPENIPRELERSQEMQAQNLRNMYKNLRPGADIESDSAYKRDLTDLQTAQARGRQDWFDQYQMGNIQTAGGLDQSQMNYQAQAIQAEIQREMAQYQVDYDKIAGLQDMLSQLGVNVVTAGMGAQQPWFGGMFGGK